MSRISVLIVEDEALVALEMKTLVMDAGFRVAGLAANVPKALRLLEEVEPDVAILDANLRGEYVTPVAEALRERKTPFIVVTGYTVDDLPPAVREDADVLPKPVNPRRLVKWLERAEQELCRPAGLAARDSA